MKKFIAGLIVAAGALFFAFPGQAVCQTETNCNVSVDKTEAITAPATPGTLLPERLLAQADWTITPGASVGPIKLDMSLKSIESILTRTKGADHMFYRDRIPLWIFYNQGVQVNYVQGKAMQIYVDKPGIMTAKGIQVGDPVSKFISTYGTDYIAHELPTGSTQPKQSFYAYKSKGLGFQTKADKILFIAIFAKL